MILYSADTARSCLRRSESCCTVRPRYSVSTTVFTPSSRDFSSATASTFSCVGTVGPSALYRFLEQVRDRLRVDRHARPHRRRDGERPEVGPLRGRGLRPHDRLDHGHCVRHQVLGGERVLADRRVHVPGLVHPKLDLARLRLAHRASDVEGHGAELRVRHEAARTEHFAEPADLTHEVGRRDGRVELHPTALDALDEVFGAHDVGARLARLALLVTLREDRDTHRLANAVRQHHRTPHHLVGMLAIDAVLRSGSFVCAISRTCCRVTLPILSLCGTAEALAIPAARFRSTAAGGVFTMNVNERSW